MFQVLNGHMWVVATELFVQVFILSVRKDWYTWRQWKLCKGEGERMASWVRDGREDTPIGQTLGSQRKANDEQVMTAGPTDTLESLMSPWTFIWRWSPRFFHILCQIGPPDVEQLWILRECCFGLSVVVWTPGGIEVRDRLYTLLFESFLCSRRAVTYGSNLDIQNKPHVFF